MRSRSKKLCRWAVETMVCPYRSSRTISVHPDDLERVECECGRWHETALGLRMARRVPVSLEGRLAERGN